MGKVIKKKKLDADRAYLLGRLDQFFRMKEVRPLDPTYWDGHEEKFLRDALAKFDGVVTRKFTEEELAALDKVDAELRKEDKKP